MRKNHTSTPKLRRRWKKRKAKEPAGGRPRLRWRLVTPFRRFASKAGAAYEITNISRWRFRAAVASDEAVTLRDFRTLTAAFRWLDTHAGATA